MLPFKRLEESDKDIRFVVFSPMLHEIEPESELLDRPI